MFRKYRSLHRALKLRALQTINSVETTIKDKSFEKTFEG